MAKYPEFTVPIARPEHIESAEKVNQFQRSLPMVEIFHWRTFGIEWRFSFFSHQDISVDAESRSGVLVL
jgi:hypothetical protein